MNYWKKNGKYYLLCVFLFLAFNLYFIFLMHDRNVGYLFYLDFLTAAAALIFMGIDVYGYRKREREKKQLLQCGSMIYREIPEFENKDIAEHDVRILEAQLQERFEENCDLQDYVAKWCHEVKIPLAASLLMDEKIKDMELKKSMREQLERINQQLNAMLLGCKLQSSIFDLQVKAVFLPECVKASIHNNQFFLIRKGFELEVRVEDIHVYTDPAWLVYVLDQLLTNAVKYVKEHPVIRIWTEKKENRTKLFVEDHGEGIQDKDIRRIFEKGFTGSNYHNGRYKSTGMGLYMVAKIIERLGHEIYVESNYGAYTRFCITFRDNSSYFNL